jgi:hypothetical protein
MPFLTQVWRPPFSGLAQAHGEADETWYRRRGAQPLDDLTLVLAAAQDDAVDVW